VNIALDSKRLNMELDRMKYEQELRLNGTNKCWRLNMNKNLD